MSNHNRFKKNHKEVIGLLPAGGQATRISPLPFSKELYPIGFRRLKKDGSLRPKVVCHFLLEKMRLAGITKAYIVLRNGKWDIPSYFEDGTMLDMQIAYLIMRLPFGAPYTIDQAYPFVQDVIIAFGFPDILFKPDDAFSRLLEKQSETNADIVLGLFPVEETHKWDMVDLCDDRICRIVIKPDQTHLRYTWIIAVWTPVFTDFTHKYLSNLQKKEENKTVNNLSSHRELYISQVIQSAIDNNLHVEYVIFPDAACLDIGTPEDLVKASKVLT